GEYVERLPWDLSEGSGDLTYLFPFGLPSTLGDLIGRFPDLSEGSGDLIGCLPDGLGDRCSLLPAGLGVLFGERWLLSLESGVRRERDDPDLWLSRESGSNLLSGFMG